MYWTPGVFFIRLGLSELTITLKDGKSFVWKSFGFVHDKSGKRIYPDQVYCTHCFESGKMKFKAIKNPLAPQTWLNIFAKVMASFIVVGKFFLQTHAVLLAYYIQLCSRSVAPVHPPALQSLLVSSLCHAIRLLAIDPTARKSQRSLDYYDVYCRMDWLLERQLSLNR